LGTFNGRVPRITEGISQIINNIIYNCGICTHFEQAGTDTSPDNRPDLIGNYYKVGPHGPPSSIKPISVSFRSTVHPEEIVKSIYMNDNIAVDIDNNTVSYFDSSDQFSLVRVESDANYTKRSSPNSTQPTHAVTIHSATQGRDLIVANAGATKPKRDSLDTKFMNDFENGTGRVPRVADNVTAPSLANGTPPTDSDSDGIPNAWEIERGLDPDSAADGKAVSSNGYTHLENYLNELAGDMIPGNPYVLASTSSEG
jgi:hypothetical protein